MRAISEVKIIAYGTTRDECLTALDELGLGMLDAVGGEPWIVMDDDTKKIVAQNVVPALGDDQGFCYIGLRTYQFRGPVVGMQGKPMGDGSKLQRMSEDE